MEKELNQQELLAKNLAYYRKASGLTQLELAEKFNYTDRAVSKWENGDTLPDVEVLYNLCEYYGVTIDYLTHEENRGFYKRDPKVGLWNKILITSLVSSVVWALATVIMVISMIKGDRHLWQAFVWAVPVNALLITFFNKGYFHDRIVYFVGWTVMVWGILTAIFVTLMDMSLWPIFILGAPAQASLIIWLNLRKTTEKMEK